MARAKTVLEGQVLDVYVVAGKRKPKLVGQIPADAKIPSTYQHEGATYHFASADLVRRSITFTAVPLTWR